MADTPSRPRGAFRPSFALSFHPLVQEGAGKASCRLAPAVRCAKRTRRKTAQQHTGVANHSAFPAQWLDGLCRALPGAELSFWPPSPRELTMLSARLGSQTPPRKLDRSNDGQDHTVLPYASAPLVRTWPRAHRDYPPCPHLSHTTLPRPPQPGSHIVTTYERPSRMSRDRRHIRHFRISVKWNISAKAY